MNRRITRTAALALLGTALLAPGTAHANIVITADSTGAPVESGDSGYLGQPLTLSGSGCTDGGMPTYLGQFSSMMGDPLLHPSMQPFEAQADEDGSVVWDFVIPLDNTLGEFHARWYCSTAPVESIDDPNMLWVGPVSTMTISNGVEPNGAQPNAMATSGALRNAGGTSTITFDQDPDGLPLVDKIEIPGEIAAELKAQVDERSETIGQVQRMYEIFLGRRADPQGLEFWEREAQTRNIKGIANRMANSRSTSASSPTRPTSSSSSGSTRPPSTATPTRPAGTTGCRPSAPSASSVSSWR